MQSLIGLSEPGARAVATITLRAIGIGVLAILLSLSLSHIRMALAAPAVLLGTLLLAILSMWINLGYFPIEMQIQLAIVSAIIGSLAGLALRRSAIALIGLIAFCVALFLWGTSTGISDDLYELARATGDHILQNAEEVADGDE